MKTAKVNYEQKILEELDQIYGLGKDARETIEGYIEYINLKQKGLINDLGNYNLFIRCPERYSDTNQIIDLIYKVLNYSGIIDEPNYYEVQQSDFRDKLEQIQETMVVISKGINLNMKLVQDTLLKFIESSTNKIFVIVYPIELERRLPKEAAMELAAQKYFSWNLRIFGRYTRDEKKKYIEQKLKHNKLKVSPKSDFINMLIKEDLSKIDKELLYITVKARANNIHTITDNFLKQINRAQYIINKSNEKSAIEELEQMIGLEPIKTQIKQILNYVKVNKNRGNMPMLNMMFTGNPGTGKSQCAKIVGRIFKENGILSDGNFVEATRTDLVGEYVGHTGPKTRAKIEEAINGVLFLDEIYSLAINESEKDYGSESIAELIKGMEEHKSDLVVILAGYDEEMEHLINANPGFRSRVPFHLHFPDYSAEELYEILHKMAKSEKYKIATNAKQLLIEHFEIARQQENFGNGRYARNIFEKLKFEQSDRIVANESADINLITKQDVISVISKLELPKIETRKIGFAM